MRPRNWNERTLNRSTRIYWRASLVPAAAVIPAPIAYIKVVAVKKLVVGSRGSGRWFAALRLLPCSTLTSRCVSQCSSLSATKAWHVYFEKIRVLKAGACA